MVRDLQSVVLQVVVTELLELVEVSLWPRVLAEAAVDVVGLALEVLADVVEVARVLQTNAAWSHLSDLAVLPRVEVNQHKFVRIR